MDNSKAKAFGYCAGAAVSAASAVLCTIFGVNEIKKSKMEHDMMRAAADTVVNSLKAQDAAVNAMKEEFTNTDNNIKACKDCQQTIDNLLDSVNL